MEVAVKHKIILLCGRICSGKGSYLPDASRIIVSNIVRAIVNSSSRDALQNSLHLDEQIAESILYTMDYALEYNSEVIVDGIRQVSIVNKILDVYPNAELVWLEVPTEERKRRYENRKDIKDVEPFEIADTKQIELECQNIYSTFTDKIKIINNYGTH